jgi:uncharacterized FAD-dependent dehydrogenase
MPIIVRNLRLEIDEPEDRLVDRAARRLGVHRDAVRYWAPVQRSVDARKKNDLHFVCQVELTLAGGKKDEAAVLRKCRPAEAAWIEPPPISDPVPGREALPRRPLVIGFGPGGMFAALRLAELGYRPIVLERGRQVRRRHRDIMQRFYRDHEFDPSSNLLFGEGGAGTYSDGKLYTRVNDPFVKVVLQKLYQFGADPDILIDARPHIGSDKLPTICWNLRDRIIALGGEVRFEHLLTDVQIHGGALESVAIRDSAAAPLEPAELTQPDASYRAELSSWRPTGPVVLAIGHSARDTVRMLASRGVRVDAKPFQIGVRLEHPQVMVDHWQFGACAGHPRLGPAEYHLIAKKATPDHADMFSFCMCPGGEILPTNESAGLIATNGASRANRSARFANSGFVITMDPASLGVDALGALEYQRKWERMAFEATGGSYRVPVQRAADYLARRPSDGTVETSYPLGGQWCDVRSLLPAAVSSALEVTLAQFHAKFVGFAGGDTIITCPETRASSPIRLPRDPETREAVGAAGLYPVGEGAGYAGGIISAAIDGIKTADKIVARYAQPAAMV